MRAADSPASSYAPEGCEQHREERPQTPVAEIRLILVFFWEGWGDDEDNVGQILHAIRRR